MPLVRGLDLMWMSVTSFLRVTWQLSTWQVVGLDIGKVEPILEWGDLSLAWSDPKFLEQSPRESLSSSLFHFSVCGFSSPRWKVCPKGGMCWSKWGLCAYRILMLCQYRHLHLRSDAAHVSVFSPVVAIPHLVLGCDMEWAGSGCLLGLYCCMPWGRHGNSSSHIAMRSLGCFWGNIWLMPTMSTMATIGLCPGSLGHLCIPRASLSPGLVDPISSAKLWHEMSMARAFAPLGLGEHDEVVVGIPSDMLLSEVCFWGST